MDPAVKKTVLRLLDYNLVVVGVRAATVQDEARDLNAFLGSWVTQCSFDPPLVAVAVRRDARSNEMIRASWVFTLNVLGGAQKALAVKFLKDLAIEGRTMSGVPYSLGRTGAPVFPSLAGHVECEVRHVWAGGDHTLFVGEVVAASEGEAVDAPLRHSGTGWHYGG